MVVLPAPFGPEEAEDLALGDLEIELDDAAMHAVRSWSGARVLDDGSHDVPSRSSLSGRVSPSPVRRRLGPDARMNGSGRSTSSGERWPS